jgi:predicted phosphodiesterase
MSNKIVLLSDPHISERQIQTRVDNSAETCLRKLEWVIEDAASLEADVICTGDLFTHTIFSSRFRLQVKEIFKYFKEDNGRRFLSVSGNHAGDVEGTDIESVAHRELGNFCFDGYVEYLGLLGGKYTAYQLPSGGLVVGYPAYAAGPQVREEDVGRVVGIVCHMWVGEAFNDTLVVYPDKLKEQFPNLKFIVSGHDHAYHASYISRDGVMVCRPGSMMRTDAGKSSDRIPCVLVMDTDTFAVEEVPIGVARPYGEVFYTEKREVDAGSVGVLSNFVRQMQERSGVVMDIAGAIREQFAVVPDVDKPLVRDDLVANGFSI